MPEEHLINFAEGKGTPDVAEHVNQCKTCQRRIQQFRRIITLLRLPTPQPLPETLKRVKALGKLHSKTTSARLVSTTLSLAGVRQRVPSSFQSVFTARGIRVRLMYTLKGDLWDIRGRLLPPVPASIHLSDSKKSIPSDPEGRFTYKVKDLTKARLRLTVGKITITVPPPNLRKTSKKKTEKQ